MVHRRRSRRVARAALTAALTLSALAGPTLPVARAEPILTPLGAPAPSPAFLAEAVADPRTSIAAGVLDETRALADYPANLRLLELQLFDRTNADRLSRGLDPLVFDVELLGIARTRAAAQIPQRSLSHVDAGGKLVVGLLLDSHGLDYDLAGENLARLVPRSDAATAERAEVALMDSPLHRKNILEPTFTHLAVGATVDPSGKVVFAQIFRAT